MKRGGVRQLLIAPSRRRWSATDRGITWVSDGFVLARVDVFSTDPKAETKPGMGKAVRRVLDEYRSAHPAGKPRGTAHMIDAGTDHEAMLIQVGGGVCLAVNPNCWEAWSATGLEPEIRSNGMLGWYGLVRGKRAFFGLVMPMRVGGYRGDF